MDIKDLFLNHIRQDEEVYMPPIKVDIVRAGKIWRVSLDEGLTNEDKLKSIRRFDLRAEKLPFTEALDLLLGINAKTYDTKVSVDGKKIPAAEVPRFCEKYRLLQHNLTDVQQVSVSTPDDAVLSISGFCKPGESGYRFVDIVLGSVRQVTEHLSKLDSQIAAYAFSKKVSEPKH